MALGLEVDGTTWDRPADRGGVAAVMNDIAPAHRALLAAGGLRILVGDRQLPNPGAERILETYSSFPIWRWRAHGRRPAGRDPGYNRDRGPASIIALRLHAVA